MTSNAPDPGASPEAAPRPRRRAASFVILVVLGLQFTAAFKLLCPPKQFPSLARFRVVCSPALWPFTDYQMYGASYAPPVEVTTHDPIAVLRDGREVPLTADALGMTYERWRRLFVDAVRRRRFDRIEDGIARFEERSGDRVVRVRLVERPFRLDADGAISPLTARVVRDLEITDAERDR